MNTPASAICSSDVIDLQGMPAGGTYSGPGTNGSLFTAGVSGPGTYTVNYFYTDANSCSNSAQATLIVDECTGIAGSAPGNNAIQIYPNPAKESLTISGINDGKMVITDAAGRLVLEKSLKGAGEKIQLESISNGIYFIGIQDSKGAVIKTSKLIKQ
jgi:hypothetical protein